METLKGIALAKNSDAADSFGEPPPSASTSGNRSYKLRIAAFSERLPYAKYGFGPAALLCSRFSRDSRCSSLRMMRTMRSGTPPSAGPIAGEHALGFWASPARAGWLLFETLRSGTSPSAGPGCGGRGAWGLLLYLPGAGWLLFETLRSGTSPSAGPGWGRRAEGPCLRLVPAAGGGAL